MVRASTGRRPAEIMRARPDDVDLGQRIWRVRDAKGGWSEGLFLNDDMLIAWMTFVAGERVGPVQHREHGRSAAPRRVAALSRARTTCATRWAWRSASAASTSPTSAAGWVTPTCTPPGGPTRPSSTAGCDASRKRWRADWPGGTYTASNRRRLKELAPSILGSTPRRFRQFRPGFIGLICGVGRCAGIALALLLEHVAAFRNSARGTGRGTLHPPASRAQGPRVIPLPRILPADQERSTVCSAGPSSAPSSTRRRSPGGPC